jgi:hypothetical protein
VANGQGPPSAQAQWWPPAQGSQSASWQQQRLRAISTYSHVRAGAAEPSRSASVNHGAPGYPAHRHDPTGAFGGYAPSQRDRIGHPSHPGVGCPICCAAGVEEISGRRLRRTFSKRRAGRIADRAPRREVHRDARQSCPMRARGATPRMRRTEGLARAPGRG